jgi:hypothetical protein
MVRFNTKFAHDSGTFIHSIICVHTSTLYECRYKGELLLPPQNIVRAYQVFDPNAKAHDLGSFSAAVLAAKTALIQEQNGEDVGLTRQHMKVLLDDVSNASAGDDEGSRKQKLKWCLSDKVDWERRIEPQHPGTINEFLKGMEKIREVNCDPWKLPGVAN